MVGILFLTIMFPMVLSSKWFMPTVPWIGKADSPVDQSLIHRWADKNLDVAVFSNGDSIPEAQTTDEWVEASRQGSPAWCYLNNNEANGVQFGKLYNWYAVTDLRGLCPTGWRIPEDGDWSSLTDVLGGNLDAGRKMKTSSGWVQAGGGSNESGFNGMPGGYRNFDGKFLPVDFGSWWSSTGVGHDHAWVRTLVPGKNGVFRYYGNRNSGFSVRCLKR